MSNPTADLQLRGALGRIERRSLTGKADFNEFGYDPPVSFKAERRMLPSSFNASGMSTALDIHARATYCVFPGDSDEIIAKAEENAMRALCRVLYQDVLDDLMPIMQAVGDGKRGEALRLLNNLYVRLNGRD